MNWSPLANHVWQSTLFGGAILLLTFAFRRNRASARFWLWMAASLKFLVPFSLLIDAGSRIEWRPAAQIAPAIPPAVEQIGRPFDPVQSATADWTPTPLKQSTRWLSLALGGIWFAGAATILARWANRWIGIRRAVRQASPLPIDAAVPVLVTPSRMEPGIFGILRPVLLLPSGIMEQLSRPQLEAILAHELCHVRRKDNLAAALHMLVEAVFWFHPLVWWIGSRLVDERERACDEEVLGLGNEPLAYAEGILHVCKFHLESPLPCAAGVTGSDLKKRIEEIMTPRILHNLTLTRKFALAAVAVIAVAGPVGLGILQAQTPGAASTANDSGFAVASIKPAGPDARGIQILRVPGGGVQMKNVTLRELMGFAYDVRPFQISGGPPWLDKERYDISAKLETPDTFEPRQATEEQRQQNMAVTRRRLQKLLAERFQLETHKTSKEMPVYTLTVGKNGHKLKPAPETVQGPQGMRLGRGEITATSMPLLAFAQGISNLLGRTVVDRTGITGSWDFTLRWTPDAGGPAMPPPPPGGGTPPPSGERPDAIPTDGPTIFTAVQEQLGLKLENAKGPVEIIVIDRAEKASAN